MKKAIAIALLATFLFNLGGYYLIFWGLKLQAARELSQKIDEDKLNEAQTFEIKIPLTLPYPLQSTGFERQTGRFEYKGEYYELVKQKYEGDVLTIVCVKDTASKEIERAADSIVESTTHEQQSKGTVNFSIKIIQEYTFNKIGTLFLDEYSILVIKNTPYSNTFISIGQSIKSPPPRV